MVFIKKEFCDFVSLVKGLHEIVEDEVFGIPRGKLKKFATFL